MKSVSHLLVAAFLTAVSITSLRADEFIADQSNEYPQEYPFAVLASPLEWVGQEFVPNSNILSFVSVVIANSESGVTNRVKIVIRPNSIHSNILGESEILSITNYPQVITNTFLFNPAVPLIPGNKYVLQAKVVEGSSWGMIGLTPTNAYNLGQMVCTNNCGESGSDLWFREGVISPAAPGAPASIRLSYVDVCWSSSPGKWYIVQYRSELTTNQWVDAAPRIAGNGFTNCFTDAILGPSRFYRVLTLP